MGGAVAHAGAEAVIFIGALAGCAIFGRFVYHHWDQPSQEASPGQRAGAAAVLILLVVAVLAVAAAVLSSG